MYIVLNYILFIITFWFFIDVSRGVGYFKKRIMYDTISRVKSLTLVERVVVYLVVIFIPQLVVLALTHFLKEVGLMIGLIGLMLYVIFTYFDVEDYKFVLISIPWMFCFSTSITSAYINYSEFGLIIMIVVNTIVVSLMIELKLIK